MLFLFILGLLSAVGCTTVIDVSEVILGEEKALNWMPWPSSVPDPNKIYTTLTLDPAFLTDIQTTTETIRITRTVISYTTETAWSTIDRYATQSTTSIHEVTTSSTTTSTITAVEVVTETADTTVTLTASNTVFLGDVADAQKTILINRFISSGFSTGNIQFSTVIVTEQPKITRTESKTAKVLRKTTETTLNTITSVGSRIVWDTVWATETKLDTVWSTLRSTSTVTMARARR